MSSFTIIALVVVPAVLVLFLGVFLAKQYKRCASNQVLVIYGSKQKNGNSAKYIHGGGAFVIPLIQDFQYLSLKPMSIEVDLKEALSLNNIRVNVPSTFTVAISPQSELLENAGQRLLGLTDAVIQEQAKDIALGQLRLVIASMTIEEINQDREKFQTAINANVAEELTKIGLQVINVNIRDITDESGYIDAIGQKAAETAKQQAFVDVAIQKQLGAVGNAEADQAQRIKVAEAETMAAKGEKSAEADKAIRIAELDAEKIEGENKSKASIAKYDADLAVAEALNHQRGQVARAEAEIKVLEKQKDAKIAELRKNELAQREVDKMKVLVDASAEADRIKVIAQGEADATLAKYKAEAEGLQAILEAKSVGYENLVKSCNGDGNLAKSLLMIEQMPEIVKTQVEALKAIKIDKVTVWDGGSGGAGAGVKGFLKDFMSAIPPMADLAEQSGIKLPSFLGEALGETKSEPETIEVPDVSDAE
jgi:flotillin